MPRHHPSPLAWFILLFSMATTALFFVRGTNYYPQLVLEAPEQVSVNFLLRAHEDALSCETSLQRLNMAVQGVCPTCKIKDKRCITSLSSSEQRILSDQPLSLPSAHLPDGVVTYAAPSTAMALAACQESQRQAFGKGVMCFPPDTDRRFFIPAKGSIDAENIGYGFLILIFAQLVAKVVCYLIIRYEHLHAHLSHDSTDAGPQKFHAVPTPRVGGIALMLGLLVASVALTAVPQRFPDKEFGLLLLAAMPAFLGGLTEDITKKVGVTQRLLLTMLSAVFGAWLLGASLSKVDILNFHFTMHWQPVALGFTVFAVAGATNAVNIIDGYNGLAAGFGIITSAAFAFIAAQLGDNFLFTANLAMAGTLLGFLVWNWPGGKVFLGDGGAYLVGFWLSELSVLLLVRHPNVSVWLPMLIMIHPVFETLFSIYRRKIKRNQHPGHPDSMHLHQLVYARFVRTDIGTKDPILKTKRNSKVCLYFWALNAAFTIMAVMFWQHPVALLIGVLLFGVTYVSLYKTAICWRTPNILKC